MSFLRKNQGAKHYGVVLESGDKYDWDSDCAGFCSVFKDSDEPKKTYVYYSGAGSKNWDHAHCAIGLSISSDGVHFDKFQDNPIVEGPPGSFCEKEALTPAVAKVSNKYYMVFAGKPHAKARRRLGIACADDPKGPWEILGPIIEPKESWEGYEIDCGTSIIPQGNSILFYYSNCLPTRHQAMINWLHSPSSTPPFRLSPPFEPSIRYTIRRVGIARIRIADGKMPRTRAYRFAQNPLQHLNGKVGSWNESLFCPGYLESSGRHLLFATASTYSTGFPYRQYIGVVESLSPLFRKNECGRMRIIIDGPGEKKNIMPSTKSELALDTPSPLLEDGKLYLYYAVMDREENTWKIALTTYRSCKQVCR